MPFKVLLISPPIFDFYTTIGRLEPLGLYYLKSAVSDIPDLEVEIYDSHKKRKSKIIQRPEIFSYLSEIYSEDRSVFSLLNHYKRFGVSYDRIITHIKDSNYDIIGISCMFSAYYPDVDDLIHRIKSIYNGPVMIGGWAVKAEAESIISKSSADIFIFKDDELSFRKIITSLMNGIIPDNSNAFFVKNSGFLLHEKTLTIDYPELDNNFFEKVVTREHPYYFRKDPIYKVITSTGCFNRCSFCSIWRNCYYKKRSTYSIRNELEYILSIGGKTVNFEDDNLFSDNNDSDNLIRMLKEYHKRGLSYTAMNGITAVNATNIIDRLIDCGFIEFNFSLVTSNTKSAVKNNRPFNISVFENILNVINWRIDTIVFLILGLPDSPLSEMLESISALSAMQTMIGVSPLYLLPSIDMFEKIGLPEDNRLMRGSALYRFPGCIKREDIASLWKFVRMINFLKSQNFNDIAMNEDLHYFFKSIHDKTWYKKNIDNSWIPSFSFSVDLPLSIVIANKYHQSKKLQDLKG